MENNLGQVVLVKDINVKNTVISGTDEPLKSSDPRHLTVFNDKLYFSANDNGVNNRELWVSDGTTEGTQLLAEIRLDSLDGYPLGSYPSEFIELNNQLYFAAGDGVNGSELWVSNGTTEGTQLLVDIAPGNTSRYNDPNYESYPRSSSPEDFTILNNKLYFTADDGVNGKELWVSDGTTEGTQLLVDIAPGTGTTNSYPNSFPNSSEIWDEFISFNDKLYFAANDGVNGRELWVTDGTTEGTQLVVDIHPGSITDNYGNTYIYGSNPYGFIEFNNKLYFSANDGVNGTELWVTDGTAEGTQLLKDISPGSFINSYDGREIPYRSYPSDFTILNDKLYFIANDRTKGQELWVSDGTAEGTQLLADINPSTDSGEPGYPIPNGSDPYSLTLFNDKIYFAADDGVNGAELWVTDGTTEGTKLLKDINSVGITDNYGNYINDSNPRDFIVFNDKLYFTANDGIHGNELWVSDGTTEGTQLVADINPDSNNSNPKYLTVLNDELFFTADDGINGVELFKLSFENSLNITGTDGRDILEGTDESEVINGLGGNDTLVGAGGDDTLKGDDANDILIDLSGDNVLFGGHGSDTLIGGHGNDLLDGGTYIDVLIGGGGDDIFVIRNGDFNDSIVDFQLGSDRFSLADGLEFDYLTFSGNTIRNGHETLATIFGVDTSHLTEADFTEI